MRILELIRSRPGFVSLEFFPPKDDAARVRLLETAGELQCLKPLFASVTCGAGGGGGRNTLETATSLASQCGFTVMPHLTCCGLGPDDVNRAVEQFLAAGLENVLALRGDGSDGKGPKHGSPFMHASDLVAHIHARYPEVCIGVAAYPEPHPESPSVVSDIAMLRLKFEAGASFGVTQLFFDNRRYFDMVERLRATGCEAPVIPGVMPLRSMASTRRILSLCGAAIPGNYYAALEAAHAQGGDDAVRRTGTEYAARQARELLAGGAPGVHLYPLNQSDQCLDVASAAGVL